MFIDVAFNEETFGQTDGIAICWADANPAKEASSIAAIFNCACRFIILFGKAGFLHHFVKARVVAQRVHNRVYLHPRHVLIFCLEGFV